MNVENNRTRIMNKIFKYFVFFTSLLTTPVSALDLKCVHDHINPNTLPADPPLSLFLRISEKEQAIFRADTLEAFDGDTAHYTKHPIYISNSQYLGFLKINSALNSVDTYLLELDDLKLASKSLGPFDLDPDARLAFIEISKMVGMERSTVYQCEVL